MTSLASVVLTPSPAAAAVHGPLPRLGANVLGSSCCRKVMCCPIVGLLSRSADQTIEWENANPPHESTREKGKTRHSTVRDGEKCKTPKDRLTERGKEQNPTRAKEENAGHKLAVCYNEGNEEERNQAEGVKDRRIIDHRVQSAREQACPAPLSRACDGSMTSLTRA